MQRILKTKNPERFYKIPQWLSISGVDNYQYWGKNQNYTQC